ncbi:hypothetical protein ACFSTD_05725 [Novosphingobium colocasiae]
MRPAAISQRPGAVRAAAGGDGDQKGEIPERHQQMRGQQPVGQQHGHGDEGEVPGPQPGQRAQRQRQAQ